MANYRYSRYQYETSPRKLEPEYEPIESPYKQKKKSTAKSKQEKVRPKRKLKSQVKLVAEILLIFAGLLVISYRNSLINESFSENEGLKTNLAAIEKENAQLRVNLENNLNLSNIEKLAEDKLGMQKLDNSQKIYVNLDKKDYVESASEEVVMQDEKNCIQDLLDSLLGK